MLDDDSVMLMHDAGGCCMLHAVGNRSTRKEKKNDEEERHKHTKTNEEKKLWAIEMLRGEVAMCPPNPHCVTSRDTLPARCLLLCMLVVLVG